MIQNKVRKKHLQTHLRMSLCEKQSVTREKKVNFCQKVKTIRLKPFINKIRIPNKVTEPKITKEGFLVQIATHQTIKNLN